MFASRGNVNASRLNALTVFCLVAGVGRKFVEAIGKGFGENGWHVLYDDRGDWESFVQVLNEVS